MRVAVTGRGYRGQPLFAPMNWNDLLSGLALYLVLEGVLPFLSPEGWRRSMSLIAALPGRQLRIFGLVSMVAGLALLLLVRGGS